jgi:hypothetical protein
LTRLEKFIKNNCEDSLTAAVFSHLLHLPSEYFWRILRKACPSPKFPPYPGEPICIHAWPNWNASGTKNTDRVIPDLVIEFRPFDLIIEAKRWDVPMQDKDQWNNELIAYTNEYGMKKHEVRMIALGGIHSYADEPLEHLWPSKDASGHDNGKGSHTFKCPVHMCQWSTVLLECQRLKRELEEANTINPSSQTYAHIRILNDLRLFFEAHGYPALKWFEDFDFKSNLLDHWVESDQQYFRNISLQFKLS